MDSLFLISQCVAAPIAEVLHVQLPFIGTGLRALQVSVSLCECVRVCPFVCCAIVSCVRFAAAIVCCSVCLDCVFVAVLWPACGKFALLFCTQAIFVDRNSPTSRTDVMNEVKVRFVHNNNTTSVVLCCAFFLKS